MYEEEILESTGRESMKLYFEGILGTLERLMKYLATDENNLFSALVIDKVFKMIILKFDSIIEVQEAVKKRHFEACEAMNK